MWHHLVAQKFHDPNTPSKKLHITFILFASMCTTYISTWLVLSSNKDSLHLLHFALIVCAWRQSTPSNAVPIQDLTHDNIMFMWCLKPKYTVGCLVFTIPLGSYFWEQLNLRLLSDKFLFKRQPLQLSIAKSIKTILDDTSR